MKKQKETKKRTEVCINRIRQSQMCFFINVYILKALLIDGFKKKSKLLSIKKQKLEICLNYKYER